MWQSWLARGHGQGEDGLMDPPWAGQLRRGVTSGRPRPLQGRLWLVRLHIATPRPPPDVFRDAITTRAQRSHTAYIRTRLWAPAGAMRRAVQVACLAVLALAALASAKDSKVGRGWTLMRVTISCQRVSRVCWGHGVAVIAKAIATLSVAFLRHPNLAAPRRRHVAHLLTPLHVLFFAMTGRGADPAA